MPNCTHEQIDQAFRGVSAYVILSNGEVVAKAAFTFAKSGLRTTCYLHVLGLSPVKGMANGGGYDKQSASAYVAAKSLLPLIKQGAKHAFIDMAKEPAEKIAGAITDQGEHWDSELRGAGFTVIQAI